MIISSKGGAIEATRRGSKFSLKKSIHFESFRDLFQGFPVDLDRWESAVESQEVRLRILEGNLWK